jgi:endonuclease/exonuclease/phosphatase family metal-dependent hydrolase
MATHRAQRRLPRKTLIALLAVGGVGLLQSFVLDANAAAATDRLTADQRLTAGEQLISEDGRFVLTMQHDGNLVEYAAAGRPIWSTETDVPGAEARLQGDGNFVVIAPGNEPVWSTGTDGTPGPTLELQNDGNLVVYGEGHVPQWASADHPPTPKEPAGSAGPARAGVKVLTYNTRGKPRDDGNDDVDADKMRFVEVLADRVAAERPDVVLLQETCASQSKRLDELLRGRHPMKLTLVVENGASFEECPGTDKSSGKAILTVGESESIPAPDAVSSWSEQGCVRWQHPAMPITVCVLHTEPAQAREVAAAFADWQGPLILGGDLNAEPKSLRNLYAPDAGGTGYMYEAAMCADAECTELRIGGGDTVDKRRLPDIKIDHIFADSVTFGPFASAHVERTTGACGGKACSDHRMLWGEFRFR